MLLGLILENQEPNQPQADAPVEPVQVNQAAHESLCWGAKVSSTFRDRVFWIADTLDLDPDCLMACMAFETGERFTANVKNPGSSATGLIQFMNATALKLGTTTEKLAAMTAENQLNFVYKYFNQWPKGTFKTLEDTYMAILYPKAIGQPLTFQMFVKGDSNYAVNAGLDANKDNIVTKAEAAAQVLKKFNTGNKPPNVWQEG